MRRPGTHADRMSTRRLDGFLHNLFDIAVLPSKQATEPDHAAEITGVDDIEVFVVSNFGRD